MSSVILACLINFKYLFKYRLINETSTSFLPEEESSHESEVMPQFQLALIEVSI